MDRKFLKFPWRITAQLLRDDPLIFQNDKNIFRKRFQLGIHGGFIDPRLHVRLFKFF